MVKVFLKWPSRKRPVLTPYSATLDAALPPSNQEVAGSDNLITVAAWTTATTAKCTLASEMLRMREVLVSLAQ